MTANDSDIFRPALARPTLLVYRECEQGHWCATGEGAVAPVCGECGGLMLPGGGPRGMYGPPDDPMFGRRERSLGFVAVLVREVSAVRLLGRLSAFIGTDPNDVAHRQARYYTEAEIATLADAVKQSPPTDLGG